MDHLKGKAAVITGASRGIGAATAKFMAAEGCAVTLAARSAGEIEALAAEIEAGGGRALAMACDVSDYGAVEAVLQATEDRFGRIDFLVNNAGIINPIGRIEDLSPEDYGKVIDVNVKGVFHGLKAALPRMRERGGVIVNISSGAATGALEGWSHYCSSKAAALSLTKCAAKENGSDPVRIVGLSPGTVATEMQVEIKASGLNPVSELDWSDHIPPEWPARAIGWLCGPDASEFSGVDVSLRDEEIRRRIGLIA